MFHDLHLPEALDHSSLIRMRDQLAAVPTEQTLVLRGASPSVFCRGLALDPLVTLTDVERRDGMRAFEQIILRLAAGSAPTIAAVDGVAMGGGLGLAAACDVVVATDRAEFGLPELLFGLVPGMIFPVLRQRATGPDLRRMALEGAAISADLALRYRLIDEQVRPDELEPRVHRWARRFRRTERSAVGLLKQWVADADGLAEEIRRGAAHLDSRLSSATARRRVEAFAAGLAPWEA